MAHATSRKSWPTTWTRTVWRIRGWENGRSAARVQYAECDDRHGPPSFLRRRSMKHRWLGPWRASFDSCTNPFRPACSPTPAGRPPHHEPHSRDKHEHGHGLHIQQYPCDESGCHHQPVRWPGRDPQRTDGQCPTTAAPQARSRELAAPTKGLGTALHELFKPFGGDLHRWLHS